MFLSGQYAEAQEQSAEEVAKGIWNERWHRMLIECQLIRGDHTGALATYEKSIQRYPTSLTLRMLGVDALRQNDLLDRAEEAYLEIFEIVQRSPARFSSRDNLIAAGRYFATRGEDARQILQLFYDRVREADPNHLESYIATAELALSKGDYAVAASTLQAAEKVDATDPRTAYLMARAFEPSDSNQASDELRRALDLNPNHIPSLLMAAENAIDAEQYDSAEKTLRQILGINPKHQQAIAMRAVIAHLQGNYDEEKALREQALKTWSRNPAVDHLIGRKLSQKYRFKEGATYQRQALTFDPANVEASFQLAQDLLRLGEEETGWELAHSVAESDEYNVVAHNLITLHERITGFRTIEADDIYVRMDPRERAIYGDDVVRLLADARKVLCQKYDVTPNAPIIVEIFPDQNDFAIRTFGLPGGAGYLGVCFGRVITANSPASQGERPSNWKSVLWHEFCHVVTLEKTKNRMPRWLSEGISVYEERQRDPSWGESMTPQYREMLLADDLTPVSNLSAAFMNPASSIHLQFAYYESSLVIEYLVENHGINAIKQILVDLGDGLTINDALTRNVGSLDKLDLNFAVYARDRAKAFGPEAEWSQDDLPEKPSLEEISEFVDEHPNHYQARMALANTLLNAKKYAAAKVHLEHLVELKTATGSYGGVLETLSAVHRNLGDQESERATLEQWIERSSDALPALKRLCEMASEENDWESVAMYGQKALAINPLLPAIQRYVANAAEQLDDPLVEIAALRALEQMDPVDPAGLDYRMAKTLMKLSADKEAKHHILAALAEAPRYRDAHRLLLELTMKESAETNVTDGPNEIEAETE